MRAFFIILEFYLIKCRLLNGLPWFIFGNMSASLKILVILARMHVLNIFHFQSGYTFCYFPSCSGPCEVRQGRRQRWALFPSDWCQELVGDQRPEEECGAGYLLPWVHPCNVTLAWPLPLNKALVPSGGPFRSSSVSRIWYRLPYMSFHPRNANDATLCGFPLLFLHVVVSLYHPICVYHLCLSSNVKDVVVCIFTLSSWLSKAVVFKDSAVGFWPPKM